MMAMAQFGKSTRARVFLALSLAAFAIAACDPKQTQDAVVRRAASSTVNAVMITKMAAPQAEAATQCILTNATQAEAEALARDFGVMAGTLTRANIAAILARPATQGCLSSRGVPVVQVAP